MLKTLKQLKNYDEPQRDETKNATDEASLAVFQKANDELTELPQIKAFLT